MMRLRSPYLLPRPSPLFESLIQVVRQVDPKPFRNFEKHPQRRPRLVVFDMRDGCPAHSNGSRKRGG